MDRLHYASEIGLEVLVYLEGIAMVGLYQYALCFTNLDDFLLPGAEGGLGCVAQRK
jgi:hypothetical protein